MIGDVLSVGDGHQGWQNKLSIKKDLELPNCPKTGAMTFKTVLDKGYGLFFATAVGMQWSNTMVTRSGAKIFLAPIW